MKKKKKINKKDKRSVIIPFHLQVLLENRKQKEVDMQKQRFMENNKEN